MTLDLKNPHSVLAVLHQRPQDVAEIRLTSLKPAAAWHEVASLAAQHAVPVTRSPAGRSGRRRRETAEKSGRRGAGVALVNSLPPVELDSLFAKADETGRPGLWLALDHVQDPHNVGAIFRTAAFFGLQGIVLTRDRSAPLNATVYDVASGGVEYVPFSIQTNLARCIDQAKQAGLWVLGTSERAEQDLAGVDRDRSWLVVLGNEETGLRRLTRERCDALCRIFPRGPVESLNVSVAAGILMAGLAGPE